MVEEEAKHIPVVGYALKLTIRKKRRIKLGRRMRGDISIKFLPRNPEQVFLSSSFKSWE